MQDQQAKIRISTASAVNELLLKGDQISRDDYKQVILALHATWSEIRKDTAKAIVRCGLKSDVLLKLVLDEIDNDNKSFREMPWQTVHGCMLGINAVLGTLGLKRVDKSNTLRVKTLCLRLQGYTQLLVREEAHKCLNYLFTNGDRSDRLTLLESMLEGVTTILSERAQAAQSLHAANAISPRHLTSSPERSPRATTEVERSAYALHGTLSLLQSMLEVSPSLADILVPPGAESDTETGEAAAHVFMGMEKTQEKHSPSLVLTIAGCLGDFSATVRQSAALALLALVQRCDAEVGSTGKDKDTAGHIRKEIIILLTKTQDEAVVAVQEGCAPWFTLESCLLVAEGLLKSGIDRACDVIQGQSKGDIPLIDYFSIYYSSLQRALPSCILSTSFEIRRIGTQVAPLLARLLCILEPEVVFANPLSTLEGSKILYEFYWLSEGAKATQHLREVFFEEAAVLSAESRGEEDTTLPSSPTSLEAHSLWAMEVTGRFGEEENKAHFRHRLRSLLQADSRGQGPIVDRMQRNTDIIAVDIEARLPVLLQMWRDSLASLGSTTLPTFSQDVAEASALALCVAALPGGPSREDKDKATFNQDTLEAWKQTEEMVPFLLTHSSGRYKGAPSPQNQNFAGRPRFFPAPIRVDTPSSAVGSSGEVFILHSVSDPTTPPALSLDPSSAITASTTSSTPRSLYSTNRNLCETIGPVFPALTVLQKNLGVASRDSMGHVASLCQLCAHWICCCLSDAQLLERRQHVRSGLSSSLAALLMLLVEAHGADTTASSSLFESAHVILASVEELVSCAVTLSAGQIESRLQRKGNARGSVSASEAVELGLLARSAKLVDKLLRFYAAPLTGQPDNNMRKIRLVEIVHRAKDLLAVAESRSSSPMKATGIIGASSPSREPMTVVIPLAPTHAPVKGNAVPSELEEQDDYSDWDEESEDELNASHSSIGPMIAEAEVENCIKELEECIQSLRA